MSDIPSNDGLKFEVKHKGQRYWAHLLGGPEGWKWNFWSDHKWPFYHGSYTQKALDRREAHEVFIDWLPFTYVLPNK